MPFFKVASVLAVSLVFGGCASWPESGSGGFAEHQANANEILIDQPLGPDNGLSFEFDLAKRHLDVLILEGADRCFPASVVRAKRNQVRIDRELSGGLLLDAANDLVIQRQQLHQLEQRLDYVKAQAECQFSTAPSEAFPIEHVDELLNSDNQFATGSAAINPKYMARLVRASEVLVKHPKWRLKITGHTDNQGPTEYNEMLSLQRAVQVSRYLQVFGVVPERIDVDAVASSDPLFVGSEPQIRLTNRRVSIELLEPNIQKKVAMEVNHGAN